MLYKRLLEKMKTQEMPLLFRDSKYLTVYTKTRPGKIMTDCVQCQHVLQDAEFVMPDPEFMWVHYEVQHDW